MSASAVVASANIKIGASAEDVKAAAEHAISELKHLAMHAAEFFGVIEATKFGVKAAYQADVGKVALDRLTGSAENTKKLLDELHHLYSGTLFGDAAVKNAAKELLRHNFLLEEIPELLQSVMDAAALAGNGADDALASLVAGLGRLRNEGHATTRDMRRFIDEGVDAYKMLADEITRTTGEATTAAKAMKLVDAGDISSDFAIQALTRGIKNDPRAAGAAKSGGDTMAGRMKEIERNVEHAAKSITQSLYKAFDVKSLFKGVAEFITGIASAVESGASRMATAVAPFRLALSTVWELLKAIGETFAAFVGGAGTSGRELGETWLKFGEQCQNVQSKVAKLRDVFIDAFQLMAEAVLNLLHTMDRDASNFGGRVVDLVEIPIQAVSHVLERSAAGALALVGDVTGKGDKLRGVIDSWQGAAEGAKARLKDLWNGDTNRAELADLDAKHKSVFDAVHQRFENLKNRVKNPAQEVADAVHGIGHAADHVGKSMQRLGGIMGPLLDDQGRQWLAMRDKIEEAGKSPLQHFREAREEILKNKMLTVDQKNEGIAQAFEKLKAATPDSRFEDPQHFMSAIMAGSVESQRLLSETSTANPMRTVEEILKEAKEIEKEQLETQRETLDQLSKIQPDFIGI